SRGTQSDYERGRHHLTTGSNGHDLAEPPLRDRDLVEFRVSRATTFSSSPRFLSTCLFPLHNWSR
ncbi:hypothetical protein CPC08DRAFT_705577, partial [Agrocybe pediades]